MHATIYLVEDQELMRESMRAYLNAEEGFQVVGTAERGEDALADLAEEDDVPDLVLIDVSLPGMSGIDVLKRLRASHPEAVCLMLSGHVEETYVGAAKAAGARGYVMKGQPSEYLEAIHTILRGETYRSGTVASMWDQATSPS